MNREQKTRALLVAAKAVSEIIYADVRSDPIFAQYHPDIIRKRVAALRRAIARMEIDP